MARTPALLLLLALGLCCPGIRGNRFEMTVRIRGSSPPQRGNRLELECRGAGEDYGISWIRQDKDGTLHFIVFISSLSKPTFHFSLGSEQTRFDVRKYGAIYQLVVKTFKAQDEGKYFCVLNNNQMLHFSSGQPAFLPVATTAAPATAAPATAAPTTQHSTTKNYTCLKTLDPGTNKWNFFCDIVIWVPLTAACLLLLIALAITVLLCQRTRSRRCRCKRSANGQPKAKLGMPTRHV